MQKRLQILAMGAPMIAIAWAIRLEHPITELVVVGCVAVFVVLALFQKDDPFSTAGLKQKAKKYAKLARSCSVEEFNSKHLLAVGQLYRYADDTLHLFSQSPWFDGRLKTQKELEELANKLDDLARRLS